MNIVWTWYFCQLLHNSFFLYWYLWKLVLFNVEWLLRGMQCVHFVKHQVYNSGSIVLTITNPIVWKYKWFWFHQSSELFLQMLSKQLLFRVGFLFFHIVLFLYLPYNWDWHKIHWDGRKRKSSEQCDIATPTVADTSDKPSLEGSYSWGTADCEELKHTVHGLLLRTMPESRL